MSLYGSILKASLKLRHSHAMCVGVYRTLEILGVKRVIGRYFHHRQADRDMVNPMPEMIASTE